LPAEIERDDLTLCSYDEGRVEAGEERWRVRMGTILRKPGDIRYPGIDMPD